MSSNTEQYFQSGLLAEELESRWQGIVQHNQNQSLSEEQKARARNNIGAVPFGSTLKILGKYDTVDKLRQGVLRPNIGDQYGVGTEQPYHLYVFDGVSSDWVDYGPLQIKDVVAKTFTDVPILTWKTEEEEKTENSGAVEGTEGFESRYPFEDYPCKGIVELEGVSENDLPIVVFGPSDASSGNYCPVAYTFNGRLEIFAKAKPQETITIPVITFIGEDDT